MQEYFQTNPPNEVLLSLRAYNNSDSELNNLLKSSETTNYPVTERARYQTLQANIYDHGANYRYHKPYVRNTGNYNRTF